MGNRIRHSVVGAIALALFLSTGAQAAQFLMSAHLDMRSEGVEESVGQDRTWLSTPQTGAGANLAIDAGRFARGGSGTRFFTYYPAVAEVISSFSTQQPAATFSLNGGPEAFEQCPPNVGAGGPSVASCYALPKGLTVMTTVTNTNTTVNNGTSTSMIPYNFTYNEVPGPPGVKGKVEYLGGGNNFGGTFSILRNTSNLVVFCVGAPNPGAVCSNQLRTFNGPWLAGQDCVPATPSQTKPRCAYGGEAATIAVPQGVITVDPVFGTMGSIAVQGSFPGQLGPPQNPNFGVGFPMTVRAVRFDDQVGTIMEAFPVVTKKYTQSGYDNRTVGGGGNIKLVGGAMHWGGGSGATYPRTTRLYMKAGAVAPLAGPGVLVALGILGGAYALRRRISAKR